MRPPTLAAPLLLAAALPLAAQDRPGRVAESIEVVEIEVPVQVLVDGRPLRGLTRDDFTLTAAGRKRRILGFREVDLEAAAGAEPGSGSPLPLAARRHFLLLFDLSFARMDKVVRARDAALDIVRHRLAADDLVSVATFSTGRGVQVLLGFTPDREQAELAISRLGVRRLAERLQDPLGLVFIGPAAADPPASTRPSGAPPGRFEPVAADQIVEHLRQTETDTAQAHAQSSLTEALAGLAESLRPVPGSKHVLYLSEGSSSTLLLGIGRGATGAERQRIEEINEAAMRGEVWNVNSNTRFGSTHHLVEFESMLKEFVRAGATVQAIDVGGLRAGPEAQSSGDDTLFMMARKTGGEYIRNHNDLELAMRKVLARTAVSYVLTFQAPADARHARYERIKVRLARKLEGARVHHRPGFFRPVPYAERSPAERRAEAARWILDDEERRGLELRVEAEVGQEERGAGRTVRVTVAVSRNSLLAGASPNEASVEIYGYALAADGRIAGHFDDVLDVGNAAGGDLRHATDLRLPAGTYELRVLAREDSQGVVGTRILELEVP